MGGPGCRALVAAGIAAVAAVCLVDRSTMTLLGAAPQTSGAALAADLEVLDVRPTFFLITGAGGNIGVQVGEDGVVVVDAGSADRAAAVVAAVKRITPRPIRYVIDTGPDADHVGGNEALPRRARRSSPTHGLAASSGSSWGRWPRSSPPKASCDA